MGGIYLGTKIIDVFKFAEAGYSIVTDYLPPHLDFGDSVGRMRNLPSVAVVMLRRVPLGMCSSGDETEREPTEEEELRIGRIREDLAAYDADMVTKAKDLADLPQDSVQGRNLLWWSSIAIVGCRDGVDFSAVADRNPAVCNGVPINSAWATLPKDVESLMPLKRVGGPPPRVVSFSVDSRVNVSREIAKGWRIDTFVEVNTLWELVVESHLVRHVKVR